MTSYTWVGGRDINGPNNWITPGNWLVGGLPATAFPSSPADDVTVNSDVLANDAIISNGQAITIASLSIGNAAVPNVPGGHVIVGGSSQIGGGGGGALNSIGAITVSSTNSGGGLVGGLGGVVTAPAMTLTGTGVVIGGGGTFNIGNIVNNGEIQADGGYFALGPLVLNSGTIAGTGFIEVDGPSTVEVNAPTAEPIRVAASRGQITQVILDQAPAFTGTLEVLNPNTTVNLFLKNEGAAHAVYNGDLHALVVTDANNTVLDTIPFVGNGTVLVNAIASTMPGYGEVQLTPSTPDIVPGVPAPVNGISTTTLSSSDLSAVLQGDQSSMRFVAGTEAVVLVDGRLSVGPDTNEAFLARLYQGLLGHAPDINGLSAWDAALNITTKADVAQAFLNTPEYQATHPGQTDTTFVQSLYHDVLGRPVDDPSLAGWTQALAGGATRGAVAAAITDSAEAKQHWSSVTSNGVFAFNQNAATVREDYQTGFGRAADTGGLSYWSSVLAGGATPNQLAIMLSQTPEFQALHGQQSNVQFVDSLYTSGLGRPATAGDETNWVGALQNGASRGDILTAVAQSPESAQHLNWPLTA